MEIHQKNVGLLLFQQPVRRLKGIGGAEIHIEPPQQVDDTNVHSIVIHMAKASSRQLRRQVVGPDDGVSVIQIIADGALGIGVISQSDHIGSGVKDPPGLLGGDTPHRGIFPVDDDEMHSFLPPQKTQVFFQSQKPRLAAHITDGRNTHTVLLCIQKIC